MIMKRYFRYQSLNISHEAMIPKCLNVIYYQLTHAFIMMNAIEMTNQ